MKDFALRLRDSMHRWGATETLVFALGLSLALLFIVAALYFGAPAAQDAIDNSPSIPEDLADHQTRGDMERGRSVGATPNTSVGHYPGAEFIASPNWSGRGTCGVEAIVLHVTGPGSLAGMDSWFKNPTSQVSATFGIGKQGEVHQYVEVGDSAWHAGIINRPDLTNPLIAGYVAQGVNPNRCTVGIELLLGGPAEPLSDYPAMQDSLDKLLDWLHDQTGVQLDRIHVIGHYQIDSINRSTDPVCCVNIDKVLKGLETPAARTVFADGWSYDSANGDWYGPNNEEVWSACNSDGLRWAYQIQAWLPPGSLFFRPSSGYWAYAGAC